MNSKNSIRHRKRKFLLVLPLLVLPFLTVLFWLFGGGKTKDTNSQQSQQGFNTSLPQQLSKDEYPANKMAYYDRAAEDSARS